MAVIIDSNKMPTTLHGLVKTSMVGAEFRGEKFEGEVIVNFLHRNGYPSTDEMLQKVDQIIEDLS